MANILPLTVSSKTADITLAGSPLRVNPFANAGITAADAPVLLSLGSNGTVGADAFAARMVKAVGQGTKAEARLFINSLAAVMGDLVDEYGAITVNTPFGTVQTFIAGTLANPQDQPDPAVNYPFLGVVIPEAYRRLFAKIETYVPTDACPVSLKRVRDKATDRRGIRGTNPFYLEGGGMTVGGEGETLELLDPVTRDKLCDISVDPEKKSKAQFLCQLAAQTAIEAGTYLVRLTTLAGGEPGGPLWPVELKVELLEAVVPPEPMAKSEDGLIKVWKVEPAEGEKITLSKNIKVTGEMLGYDGETGDGILCVNLVFPGDITYECVKGEYQPEATELVLMPGEIPEELAPGDYEVEMELERVRNFEHAEVITVHNLPVTVEA